MTGPAAPPLPLPRILARGRPASDPACAGCALLGLFRALRRAGLDVQGGAGCDPDAPRALEAAPGRWAAVLGAADVGRGARAALREAGATGARLVAVADRAGSERAVMAALEAAGADALRVDPADLAASEEAARLAEARGAVLVALSPCAREAAPSAPLAVAAARCNRCGACLALGCPALSDPGGDAVAIDPRACTGCGLCAPLCRGRAIAR